LILSGVEAKTLPVVIAGLNTDAGPLYGEMSAAAVMVMLPNIVMTLALQRYLVKGLTLGASRGRSNWRLATSASSGRSAGNEPARASSSRRDGGARGRAGGGERRRAAGRPRADDAGPSRAERFSYVIGRPDPGPWSAESGVNRVTLSTGHIVVEASLDPWQLTFRTRDGRLLTHQVHDDANSPGSASASPGLEVESLPHDPARRVHSVVETLLLDPRIISTGLASASAGSICGPDRSHLEPEPVRRALGAGLQEPAVVIGSRGYGLFVDVPTAVDFHLGSRSNRAYTVEADGDELDYYLIAGTPKEIVTAYTELTVDPRCLRSGRSACGPPPASCNSPKNSVLEVARRLRAEGIPCDVFHLDSFWQRAYMWCDFEWDAVRLPDPRGSWPSFTRRDSTTACGSIPTCRSRATSIVKARPTAIPSPA